MGGKKKGGGGKAKGKGAAAPEGEDIEAKIEKFYKQYKRKCTEYEVPICPIIREKIELFQDEQVIPDKFHIWTELGWAGARAIMDALRE